MVKVMTSLSTKRNRLPRIGDIVHVSIYKGVEVSCVAAIVTETLDKMMVQLTIFHPGSAGKPAFLVTWGDGDHEWHYPTDDLMIVWPERKEKHDEK